MAKKTKEKELDMAAIENQKIVDVDLNSEMKKSYISYAMSVWESDGPVPMRLPFPPSSTGGMWPRKAGICISPNWERL